MIPGLSRAGQMDAVSILFLFTSPSREMSGYVSSFILITLIDKLKCVY